MKRAAEVFGYGLCAGVIVLACVNPSVLPTPTTFASQCQYQRTGDNVLPDPQCTPGAINPAVTQATISTTICKAGWTATIRPAVSYTEPIKLRQMHDYAASGRPSQYEEDHLIPLELGGAPDDPRNLWPEPGASPNAKDSVENTLRERVCSNRMLLADAQQKIRTNWTTAL